LDDLLLFDVDLVSQQLIITVQLLRLNFELFDFPVHIDPELLKFIEISSK